MWRLGNVPLPEPNLVDLARPDRLVISGPYTVSRNPMYVGWALLHLGVGAVSGSAWVVAVFPGAAWWVHRQVMGEERALSERFEDEFRRYRAAVPRYLPGLRRPGSGTALTWAGTRPKR